MLEVEAKYPVEDFTNVERQLRGWSATFDEAREDADQYFNAPDRDFAKTDEALRVRRIGNINLLTYKGPKTDAQTKTRTEIEVALASGDQAAEDLGRLLVHLGYQPVATVRKRRTVCHLQREGFYIEVCMDSVNEVGRYVEIEIMAGPEKLNAAKTVVLKLAGELGLKNQERRSYLEMLLKNRG